MKGPEGFVFLESHATMDVDHMAKMTAPGGEAKKRGKGLTLPGHITPLLALHLADVNEDTLAAWFAQESRRSKHQATRALMMFRGFLRWASAQPEYRTFVDRDAGKAPAIMDKLPEMKRRTDALEAAQVAGWWSAVAQLPNPTASAYLRGLLLTGARREELASLRWEDVDFTWNSLTIRDKVEGERVIPLTPYVASLLAGLPRRNEWVFSSTRALRMDAKNQVRRERKHSAKGTAAPEGDLVQASATGHLADPSAAHRCACATVGLEGLTLHGLRRSFASLTEWLEVPTGVVEDAVVLAGGPTASELAGLPTPEPRSSTCLWYEAADAPAGKRIVLDGDGTGPVNNVAVMSAVAPSYAPPGRALIAASCVGLDADDDAARAQLSRWFGSGVGQWRLLRTDPIEWAQHAQPPGSIGGGAFERGMLVYQQGTRQFFFNHAHNEYLQILTEGGLLVGLPCAPHWSWSVRDGRPTFRVPGMCRHAKWQRPRRSACQSSPDVDAGPVRPKLEPPLPARFRRRVSRPRGSLRDAVSPLEGRRAMEKTVQ